MFFSALFHLPRSLDSRLVFGHRIIHTPQKEAQVGLRVVAKGAGNLINHLIQTTLKEKRNKHCCNFS